MTDNTVTIAGNLTRELELRFTPTGQATATFGIAANRTWTDRQSQELRESTSFFDVVAWAALAENVATSLAKGTRVVVTGRLDQRSWETAGGDTRSKVKVTADEICPSLRWATVQVTRTERRVADAGARDKALLLVSFVGAMRRSELVALDFEDVNDHS